MSGYVYTDLHAAAWMAKHFKMQFEASDGSLLEWDGSLGFFRRLRSHRPERLVGPRRYEGYPHLRIHPGSLPLLKPQTGDLGEQHGFTFKYSGLNGWYNGDWDHPKYPLRTPEVRIIQRSGKVFHWPEREP